MTASVNAIVVVYKPDIQVLHAALSSLHSRVSHVWLMINADFDDIEHWTQRLRFKSKLSCVDMKGNQGIGAALNRGFQLLQNNNVEYALILDQDSLISFGMVNLLLAEAHKLRNNGVPVALVAPRYRASPNMPLSSFARHGWLGKQYVSEELVQSQSAVEIDFAISSGSLIPMKSVSEIGPMDEGLFIDHVDTEWCLRAQDKGYKIWGVSSAHMIHTLGDNRTLIWLLRWRSVPYHSSFRYYYILRNSILLQKRNYVPIKWRVGEVYRFFSVIIFYTIFSKDGLKNFKMMSKGIWHGIKGQTGPMI